MCILQKKQRPAKLRVTPRSSPAAVGDRSGQAVVGKPRPSIVDYTCSLIVVKPNSYIFPEPSILSRIRDNPTGYCWLAVWVVPLVVAVSSPPSVAFTSIVSSFVCFPAVSIAVVAPSIA